MGMQISVIIPVYKVEDYIEECIESVLSQSYRDIEVILVDDGTPDHSAELCKKYLNDSRVKLIQKKNGGLSSARNVGIQNAQGDYLVFLDSDDLWCDESALMKIAGILEQESPDILIFGNIDYNCITNQETKNVFENRVYCGNTDKNLLIKSNAFRAAAWNKVISNKLFHDHDMFFIEGIVGEDNDWCARLLLYAEKIITTDICLYRYRKYRSGSITSGTNEKYVCDLIYSLEKCLSYFDNYSSCDEQLKNAYFAYVAYFYLLIIGEAAQLTAENRYDALEKIKKYRWVLKYGSTSRTRISYWVHKLFGYHFLAWILGKYYKMHSRI